MSATGDNKLLTAPFV